MFVRLATFVVDSDCRQPLGVFQASQELNEEERLDEASREELEDNTLWFNQNLRVPPREAFRNGRAICWFKSAAQVFVARLWERAHILRRFGRHVQLLTSRDPGLRTYEDEAQVVVIPRRRDLC